MIKSDILVKLATRTCPYCDNYIEFNERYLHCPHCHIGWDYNEYKYCIDIYKHDANYYEELYDQENFSKQNWSILW